MDYVREVRELTPYLAYMMLCEPAVPMRTANSQSAEPESGGVAVESRRPMAYVLLLPPSGLQEARGQHPLSEGVLVQLTGQDRLVDLLEVEEGEGLRQQLEGHGCVVELAPKTFDREAEDLGMVEG